MRAGEEGGGCFPTGKHYPGIAHLLRIVAQGLVDEFDGALAVEELLVVSIDTETTGKDPAVDRVIELGAVVFKNGEVVSRHRWLMNPGVPIPKEAFDVHGISDDHVKDSPPFSMVAVEILAVLEGKIPLAYNADFDRAFLVEELGRAGVARPAMPPAARRGIEWLDPLVWARELHQEEKSRSLGDVAERLGIALDKAHSAVHDAEAAAFVHAAFCKHERVPRFYGAFVQEQRRLARLHAEDRQYWRK
ncbi:MAG TPA: 3'-5' exonuclease [Polyangiaceae bacterium]|jgi:DNA polymerase-3 subunit epsilon|nr:3'-5' exonuclease [Polyangiaceae bacterium]